MSFSGRSVATVALLLGGIIGWSSAVVAADWPRRTVHIIAPVPAGSGTDFSARLFAERLSQRWGQPVIVENRPGADGVIGVSAFLGTDDDHTLLFSISAVVTIHPVTHEKLPYDPVRELVPISSASDVVLAIAASEKNSIRSLSGLVEAARAQSGKLNWSSSPGLPPFVIGGFLKNSKLNLTFVSYRELAPALLDLGEGRIDVLVHALGVLMPVSRRAGVGPLFWPARIFGENPLLAYILVFLVAPLIDANWLGDAAAPTSLRNSGQAWFDQFTTPNAASLLFALSGLVVLLAILVVCHRKRWILKL